MREMPIVWKRLVKSGETCTRCGNTGRELEAAMAKLAAALRPLGIAPMLETRAVDENEFKTTPSESNRMWIPSKPVEEWLGAGIAALDETGVTGASRNTLKQHFRASVERGTLNQHGIAVGSGTTCVDDDGRWFDSGFRN